MAVAEYSYNGKFEENILIVGQTDCGKTTFIQNIAKNNLFDKLKEIFWISKIPLSMEREKNISTCFKKTVRFKYSQTVDNYNVELTFFQRKRDDNVDIVMIENNIFNKLIVMDDVSGLANKSNDFVNFLPFSRKFNFTCISVFYTMYPTRSNWQIILSQRKIFNVFLGLCKLLLLLKIYPHTVIGTPTSTFHTETFG